MIHLLKTLKNLILIRKKSNSRIKIKTFTLPPLSKHTHYPNSKKKIPHHPSKPPQHINRNSKKTPLQTPLLLSNTQTSPFSIHNKIARRRGVERRNKPRGARRFARNNPRRRLLRRTAAHFYIFGLRAVIYVTSHKSLSLAGGGGRVWGYFATRPDGPDTICKAESRQRDIFFMLQTAQPA